MRWKTAFSRALDTDSPQRRFCYEKELSASARCRSSISHYVDAKQFVAGACHSAVTVVVDLPAYNAASPILMTVHVNEYGACQTISSADALLDATMSNVPPGFDLSNSPPAFPGWCTNLYEAILDYNLFGHATYDVALYSSLSAGLPADVAGLPLNKINYILNIDTLITSWPSPQAPPTWLDKQAAIWQVIYGDCSFDSNGQFICPNEDNAYTSAYPFPYGPSPYTGFPTASLT